MVLSGELIHYGTFEERQGERTVIDAQGWYLTPSFIDHHCHVYPTGTEMGLYADTYAFPQGCTALVDAGSTGVANYRSFQREIATGASADIYAYLNVAAAGQVSEHNPEYVHPDFFSDSFADFLKAHPGIRGLKIRFDTACTRNLGLRPLNRAAEIAHELDESREQRLDFMQHCVEKIKMLLKANGIEAEVSGRPKHIYSIYKKMVRKHLRFDQLFDIRAMRIIVDTVERCYEVLSLVHENFTVLSKEYDDYIAHPKPNGYQSLHTVVTDPSGKPVEIQIRTRAMHQFAELGVAAHWRYKETGNSNKSKGAEAEDQRVAWLRQLLQWKSDVQPPQGPGLEEDHVYALTPQGRVVELPHGATPIDFAYQVHTELGHRCRGAKVNGAMVPLNYQLQTGQTVEIVAGKTGGPSRDWLNPELGFAVSARTRTKVRQWFNAQALAQQMQAGREKLDKELARLGKTAFKLEDLAKRLSYDSVDDLCVAFAKEEFSIKALEQAVQPQQEERAAEPEVTLARSQQNASRSNVLVVGVDSLMTQLARCCHPAPPDEIVGFVTRGRGVTIHRMDCPNVKNLAANEQERIIEVSWGNQADAVYPVDIYIVARDRQGLLKDISEVLMREKLNITGINTVNVKGDAHMRFSIEIRSSGDLQRALTQLREIKGVMSARRA